MEDHQGAYSWSWGVWCRTFSTCPNTLQSTKLGFIWYYLLFFSLWLWIFWWLSFRWTWLSHSSFQEFISSKQQQFASSATINHSFLINFASSCNHLWSKYFTTSTLFCFYIMQSKMKEDQGVHDVVSLYHWMLLWVYPQRGSPRLQGGEKRVHLY